MIGAEVQLLAARAEGLYQVFVVPLLVESGRWLSRVDRVCVVDCDEETQIARVMQRSGLTRDAVLRILSAQATRAQRLAVADDVLVNDGTTTRDELRHRVHVLHERWMKILRERTEGSIPDTTP